MAFFLTFCQGDKETSRGRGAGEIVVCHETMSCLYGLFFYILSRRQRNFSLRGGRGVAGEIVVCHETMRCLLRGYGNMQICVGIVFLSNNSNDSFYTHDSILCNMLYEYYLL